MAGLHEFKPSISAWIVLAMIICFASSMIVVLPLLRSSHPMLLHGIINPRYRAVPLDRSSDGMEERDQMEEGETGSGGDNYFADIDADAVQILRGLMRSFSLDCPVSSP